MKTSERSNWLNKMAITVLLSLLPSIGLQARDNIYTVGKDDATRIHNMVKEIIKEKSGPNIEYSTSSWADVLDLDSKIYFIRTVIPQVKTFKTASYTLYAVGDRLTPTEYKIQFKAQCGTFEGTSGCKLEGPLTITSATGSQVFSYDPETQKTSMHDPKNYFMDRTADKENKKIEGFDAEKSFEASTDKDGKKIPEGITITKEMIEKYEKELEANGEFKLPQDETGSNVTAAKEITITAVEGVAARMVLKNSLAARTGKLIKARVIARLGTGVVLCEEVGSHMVNLYAVSNDKGKPRIWALPYAAKQLIPGLANCAEASVFSEVGVLRVPESYISRFEKRRNRPNSGEDSANHQGEDPYKRGGNYDRPSSSSSSDRSRRDESDSNRPAPKPKNPFDE